MMNIKRKILLLVFAGLASATSLYAAGVGTTAAQFLKIGVGARAVAMGGAFSAVADNIDAIYWNPAGLADQKDKQVKASYIQYFQGINIGFLGYSQPIGKLGALGVGLNYLTIGGIERRTTDVDTAEGTFGANDMALYLSYADTRFIKLPGLRLGANLKVLRQTLDDKVAQSFALDVAGLYKTPLKNLTAALGIYNLGTSVKFINDADPLPLNIRLSGAYRLMNDALVVALDVDDYIYDERITESLGLEYSINKALSARAGYKLGMDSQSLGGLAGFSAGFGVNVWSIQLDYAFVPYGELSDTHRITLSTKF